MNHSYLITDKMRNDLIAMCTHLLGYVEKGDHSAEQAYYVREELEKLAAIPELQKTVRPNKLLVVIDNDIYISQPFDQWEDGDIEADHVNGHYRVLISKQDGKYFVANAVDGFGSNCKEKFTNSSVEIYTPLGAAWQKAQDGWISVEERLPECFLHIGNKKRTNWVIGIRNRDQFICVYTKGHQLEFGDDDYDGEYDEVEDRNGTLYLKPGWYSLENTPNGLYDEVWMERNPTHWRPLPEPPVKQS